MTSCCCSSRSTNVRAVYFYRQHLIYFPPHAFYSDKIARHNISRSFENSFPMIKYLLDLKVTITLCVFLTVALNFADGNVAPALEPPVFVPVSDQTVFQTDVKLELWNGNAGAATEIYRSTSADGDYQLIYTQVATTGTFAYVDRDLKPRTVFYYKARAVNNSETSAFTAPFPVTTSSKFFAPSLTPTVNEDLSVSFILQDLSYQDNFYEIFRRLAGNSDDTFIAQTLLLDSGQSFVFQDSPDPGMTYEYYVNAGVQDEGSPTYYEVTNIFVEIPPLYILVTPEFTTPAAPAYETDLIFGINNPNEESETEIFRSTSAEGVFEFIASVPWNETTYLDQNLKPRTTYYYKIRARREDTVTAFSSVLALTTDSNFYAPEIIASAASGSSVEITVIDKSYNDVSYDLWRSIEGAADAFLIETFSAADSGQVFNFIDEGLTPSTTYHYRIDARTKGAGNPLYTAVATDTAYVGESGDELPTPEFTTPGNPGCGKVIIFGVSNQTSGASTEIYRSLNPSEGFNLRYTLPAGETNYVDGSVSARTTYYYTMRAVLDGETSGFSDTIALTSGSTFYNPILEADVDESGQITLTFTDRTYAEGYYEIYKTYRANGEEIVTELFKEVITPDSGSTTTITDPRIFHSGEIRFVVNAILSCAGNPTYFEVAGDTLYRFPEEELTAPYFDFSQAPSNWPCGNEIAFVYVNENSDGYIEIYRSQTATGPFDLISTEYTNYGTYRDRDVASRKTYYYKLRVVRDEDASPYSNTESFTAGAAWFTPELTATALGNNSVELKLYDRSYLDLHYEIYGIETGTNTQTFYSAFSALDSGGVHTMIDDTVIPGKSYSYFVNATLDCDGQPVLSDVASDTVSIPDSGPAVLGFILVDPVTDQEVQAVEGYTTFDVSKRYNIRAVANAETQSVQFFLNGKRFGENQEPYALFGDRFGNYNRGRLKAGSYVLTATAYSGNNQKGVKGNTITLYIEVTDEASGAPAATAAPFIVNVDVFPNPIVNHATIEVSGEPNRDATLTIIDDRGNRIKSVHQKTDPDGAWINEFDVQELPRGTYFVIVKIDDTTLTKRIIVK